MPVYAQVYFVVQPIVHDQLDDGTNERKTAYYNMNLYWNFILFYIF